MKLISSTTKRIALLTVAVGAMGAASDGGAPARLVGMTLSDGRALALAQSLSDEVGARPCGSPGAAHAVDWAVAHMKALGLKNVHTEPVKVPRWVRGEATAEIVGATPQRIAIAALGPSVPTPAGGVTADVIEVWSFDELKALGDKAKGKIVLFNHAMKKSRGFEEYGRAVGLRGGSAMAAGSAGALLALVRSAGSSEYRLPHTGAVRYDVKVPPIPAAAISAEDADLIHRLLQAGKPVRIKATITAHSEGEVESANVIGEVPGREKPAEVMLLGAHLDSWDLGTGALDDGAGVAIVLDAARAIAALPRAPRRTVRVVLFMNEEMGLSGALAYAAQHAGELGKHVGALEADSGSGRAYGVGVASAASALPTVKAWVAPLATLGVTEVKPSEETGADLTPLEGKVPLLGLTQDMSAYFDWHHTAGDTFDKIDPLDLAIDAATAAVVAYGVADAPAVLPPSPPPTRRF